MEIIEYYIDEAGDPQIYNKKGGIIIGNEGCSKYFIMGVAWFRDVELVIQNIKNLRKRLRSDPYFDGIPSLSPEANKTYNEFHATNDHSDVRKEVFELINNTEVIYSAVVRNKKTVIDNIIKNHTTYKYKENDFYDHMIGQLLKDKFNIDCHHKIIFAERSNKHRTDHLKDEIFKAWKIHTAETNACILDHSVEAYCPDERLCLQIVDYFNWAVQRVYEKGEERYIKSIWKKIDNVWDRDDRRSNPRGERYTQENPLEAAKIMQKNNGTHSGI